MRKYLYLHRSSYFSRASAHGSTVLKQPSQASAHGSSDKYTWSEEDSYDVSDDDFVLYTSQDSDASDSEQDDAEVEEVLEEETVSIIVSPDVVEELIDAVSFMTSAHKLMELANLVPIDKCTHSTCKCSVTIQSKKQGSSLQLQWVCISDIPICS